MPPSGQHSLPPPPSYRPTDPYPTASAAPRSWRRRLPVGGQGVLVFAAVLTLFFGGVALAACAPAQAPSSAAASDRPSTATSASPSASATASDGPSPQATPIISKQTV